MRTLLSVFSLVCVALLFSAGPNQAQDKKDEKKEATFKGRIVCAKCELNQSAECQTVLVLQKDKKDVIIYFDKASHGKYHDEICASPKKGTVVGTVKDADNKKVIAVKSVTFDK